MKNKKVILVVIVLVLIGAISILPKSSGREILKKEVVVDKKDLKSAMTIFEQKEDNLICLEVITTLYEDDDYIYSVPSSCYADITYVSFADGSKMSIKQALFENRVSIDELIKLGAKIYKEGKVSIQPVSDWTLKTIPSGLTCASVIVTLYEDSNYKYTVSNPCYIYDTYVVYRDGSKYNLQDALNMGKVTIDELIKVGAKISKEGIVSIQPVEDVIIQPVYWYLENRGSGRTCASVMTTLYEDNDYRYRVSSPCYINETYVVYSSGVSYNIKMALELGKVTITELIAKGAIIYKEGKVSIQPVDDEYRIQPVTWKLETISSGRTCASVMTTLYEDSDYRYSVSSPCYISETYVVYNNGIKYNIEDALNMGKVTIDELISEGARIYKDGKVSIYGR